MWDLITSVFSLVKLLCFIINVTLNLRCINLLTTQGGYIFDEVKKKFKLK